MTAMQVEDSARTVWERSTFRRYLRSFLRSDLAVLWWLRRSPTGRFFALPMRHVISMNPLRDVAMLTWTGLAVGVFYSGYHFTMNCALNAGAVLLVRALIQAKRPIERVRPRPRCADRRGRATGHNT